MALPIPCCSIRGGGSPSRWRHAILYVFLVLFTLNIHPIFPSATGNYPQLRRGHSLLGREEDVHESGLALFKRGATLRRRRTQPQSPALPPSPNDKKKRGCWNGPGPGGPWMTYCLILTFLVPGFLLRSCGLSILFRHTCRYPF